MYNEAFIGEDKSMLSSRNPGLSAAMTVMCRAALKASKGLLRDFNELEHLQVSRKPNNDFVTAADLNSDRIIRRELLSARPDYGLISEEGNDVEGNSKYRWIVDPLDGTANFMHGFPNWAVSIALQDVEKDEILSGVTYDPVKDEMFLAEKGRGAFMNDRRLRVSGRRDIASSLCAIRTIDSSESRMACSVMRVRKIGSTTLNFAYTAAGRYDVFLPGEKTTINIWDCAVGILLVREAGGVMGTKTGKVTNKFDEVSIISNIDLLTSVVKLLYK